MWGPYGRNWERVRKATSRRFLRGHVTRGRDDTRHDLGLRGKGRRFRPRRPLWSSLLRGAFAIAAAVFLVVACWNRIEDLSMAQTLLAPFALVAFVVTWLSDLSWRWKVALSIPLLVFLLPLVL